MLLTYQVMMHTPCTRNDFQSSVKGYLFGKKKQKKKYALRGNRTPSPTLEGLYVTTTPLTRHMYIC